MMKNRKIYSRLSILVIIILLLAGTQVLAVTLNRVTNVKAKPTANAVTVTWNKVTNAKEYEVSIYIPGIGYVPQPRVKTTSKYISGLDKGETYKVKVRAISGSSSGQYSTEVSFRTSNSSSSGGSSSSSSKPARVTGLRTTRVTNDAVTLTWNRSSGATGYKVYVYIPGMGYTYVQNVTGTTATVTGFTSVTGNENGLNYRAKIIAFNSRGDAAESAEVNFRTPRSSSSGGGSSSSSRPTKVTNLRTVTVNSNTATFRYNAVSGATEYEIALRTANTSYKVIGRIKSTNLQINNLQPGVTYYLKIAACNSRGVGDYSSEIRFTTTGSSSSGVTPGKVMNVKTVATSNTVTVSWNAVSNATEYEVSIYIPGIGYVPQPKVRTTSKYISGLNAGTTYKVKVRAYKGTTQGAYSDEKSFKTNATTVPSNPTTPTVAKVTGLNVTPSINSANISWNTVSGATQYEIAINGNPIGKITGNRATLTGLQAGTTYRIKVRAYKGTTQGAYSDEKSFKTNATTVPSNPTTSTVAKVTGLNVTPSINRANISWNTVPGATQYEVAINGNPIGKITGNRATLTGLQAGTTYRIKVRACIGTTTGAYSDEKSFKTNSTTSPSNPTTPSIAKVTGLNVTEIKDKSAKISWNRVSGATQYQVYYRLENQTQGYSKVVTGTYVEITGLIPGSAYCVNVKALNGGVAGEYNTNPVRFTTKNNTSSSVDFYNGIYELPLKGATGWASIKLNIRENATSSSRLLGTVNPGTSFTIIEQNSNWLKVMFRDGSTGYVYAPYVLLNLPDVIPSIVYYDSNSASSIFKSSGVDLPNITGNKLYNVYNNNTRLGCYQYDMPVLFGMAVKIAKAQKAALAEGYSLKIYESFRPYDTQTAIASSLTNLMANNTAVANGIKVNGWKLGWFISTGTSNHQQGIAIDVTLVKVNETQTKVTGDYKYTVVTSSSEVQMPTAMHELSVAAARYTTATSYRYAATMNDNAKKLERYCTSAGLIGLQSEWWHFNDNATLNSISSANRSNGRYTLQPNLSVKP